MTEQSAGDPADRQIRPFADFIGEQQSLADKLSEGLNEVLAAVADTGKPGQITLVVKVKPVAKNDNGQVLVTSDVAVKAPKADTSPRVYFIDGDFNLTRSDPRQPELTGLREVPRTDETPRTLPAAGSAK